MNFDLQLKNIYSYSYNQKEIIYSLDFYNISQNVEGTLQLSFNKGLAELKKMKIYILIKRKTTNDTG